MGKKNWDAAVPKSYAWNLKDMKEFDMIRKTKQKPKDYTIAKVATNVGTVKVTLHQIIASIQENIWQMWYI